MADTGFVEFTVSASIIPGSLTWTNPANALTSTSTFGSVRIGSGDISYRWQGTASADLSGVTGTVDGFEVEIIAAGDDGGADEMYDEEVYLIVGGVVAGTNKALATQWSDVSPVTRIYGGPTDKWGLTLTDTQVKASNFGVAFRVNSFDGLATMELYRIRIKVYYTPSGGGSASASGVIDLSGVDVEGIFNTDAFASGAIDLSGVDVEGVAFATPPGSVDGDSLQVYLTGANRDGGGQRDVALSLGGYRSSQVAESMTWDTQDPMVGLEVVGLSGGNGPGTGTLTAASTESVTWTPPGGMEGLVVPIAEGEEKTLFGFGTGAWIRVRRVSTIPLVGAHTVKCIDCYNNVIGMGNVPHADAVSGETYYRAVILKNVTEFTVMELQFWLDSAADGDIAIAFEALAGGLIQTITDETTAPIGLTWNTGESASNGLQVGPLAADAAIGLWIRRTIAVDADPSPSQLTHIRYQYSDPENTYANALRGRHRIKRTDFVMEGVWVGQDAPPDLTAVPDETWTSRPHATSLGLVADHDYYCIIQQRNYFGLWSQYRKMTVLPLNASGGSDPLPPSAPSDVLVGQNSDDEAVITGRYEPAPDEDHSASIFVVYLTTDETTPDTAGTPTGYQVMNGRAGIEILNFANIGTTLLDGTPVNATVRCRRIVVEDGDAFTPDTTQLPASGAGTIVVATELSGWASTGFLKVADFNGNLREIVAYDSLVVGGGISTFTVIAAGRGQWGTTSGVTSDTIVITEVSAIDSTNTDVASGVIGTIAPGRPWGDVLFGANGKQTQAPISGPDGVTKEYVSVPNNIYLLAGEGWSELWIDTALAWRVVSDGNDVNYNRLYIPSEWDLVADVVGGAAVGTDVVQATTATDVYLVAQGVRHVHLDATAMTITALEFWAIGGLPDVAPQATTWRQYAGSLLQVWNPSDSDYRPFLQVSSAGEIRSEYTIETTLTQAQIAAL